VRKEGAAVLLCIFVMFVCCSATASCVRWMVWCGVMCTTSWCVLPRHQGPPGSTRVHQGPPGSTRVHQGLPGSTRVHQGPPGSTRVHQGPPGSTRVHQGPPGSTRVHQGLLVSLVVVSGVIQGGGGGAIHIGEVGVECAELTLSGG
jgi:hypothetical protein